MPEMWYSIGSFTFPSSWGAIIASFVLTYLFLYFWNRKASDWYSSAVFYFILTWKLSVIVVDFQTVIDHPLTILYFHGGRVGYWLGILAALLYIILKRGVSPSIVVIAWTSTMVSFEFVHRILELDILSGVIQLIINGILFLFLLKKSSGLKREIWIVQLVVVFTLLQLLFHSLNAGFTFTTVTWTYVVVMIYLIALCGRRNHIE